MPKHYRRGEVYWVNLNPTEGHEQAGMRPCLIVSNNRMNDLPIEMCVVLPITSKVRSGIPSRIDIAPPEGGMTEPSQILCQQIRAVSHTRIRDRSGAVHASTMTQTQDILRLILALDARQ